MRTPIIPGLNTPKLPTSMVEAFERDRANLVTERLNSALRQGEFDARQFEGTDEERAAIKRRLDQATFKGVAEWLRQHDQQQQTIVVLERALALALDAYAGNPDMADYFIRLAEVQLHLKPLIIDQAEGGATR